MKEILVVFFCCLSVNLSGQTTTTVDEFIGMNVRIGDPIGRISRFNFVRNHHSQEIAPQVPEKISTKKISDHFSDKALIQNSTERKNTVDFTALWNPSAIFIQKDSAEIYSNSIANRATRPHYDEFYRTMRGRSAMVLTGNLPEWRKPKRSVPYLTPELPGAPILSEMPPPVRQETPALYRTHSRQFTRQVVRYGRTPVSYRSNFQIAFGENPTEREDFDQPLGYIRYFENQNEPDKTWHDQPWIGKVPVDWENVQGYGTEENYKADHLLDGLSRWHMSPGQYAALLSADYDGHLSSAPFVLKDEDGFLGLKNADSEAQMVMAGLADLRGKYVNDIRAWSELNRGPDNLPFNVLNFHHYSSNFNPNMGFGYDIAPLTIGNPFKIGVLENPFGVPLGAHGVAPEEEQLREKILQLDEYLDDEFDDMPMWISEFGYDTHPFSVQAAIPNILNPEWPVDQTFEQVPYGPQGGQLFGSVTLSDLYTDPDDPNADHYPLRRLLAPWQCQEASTSTDDDGNQITQCASATATATPGEGLIRKIWTELHPANREYLFELVAQAQADWTVRSYLEMLATERVERAMAFCIRDDATIFPSYNISVADTDNPGETLDVPATSGYLFTTSGLLTDEDTGFSPKKSWYWVQTLKNVLYGYKFERPLAILNQTGGQKNALLFSKGDRQIIVAWMATGNGTDYEGQVAFMEMNSNGEPNGITFKLTEFNDPYVTATYFKPLNTTGVNVDVSDHIIQTEFALDNFKLTETPIFIKLGFGREDEPVEPVTTVVPTASCCNGVKLTWNNNWDDVRYRYANHSVYYVKADEISDPNVFSLSRVSTFTTELPGTASSVIIPNLEADEEYYFYVIPRAQITGNTPDLDNPDVILSSRNATSFTVEGDNCSDCIVQVSEDMIEYDSTTNGQFSALIDTAFTNHGNQSDCHYLNDPGSLPVVNANAFTTPFEIIVDLGEPTYLEAIQYIDGGGIGRIKVEYFYCGCWYEIGLMDTRRTGVLRQFSNFLSSQPYGPDNEEAGFLTKLRFTLLDEDSNLSHVFLCGRPSSQSCPDGTVVVAEEGPGSNGPDGGEEIEVAPVEVVEVRPTSAKVRWKALNRHPELPGSPTVEEYKVLLSDQTLDGENPEGAEDFYVRPLPNEPSVEQHFAGLQPATTYYGRIERKQNIKEQDCFIIERDEGYTFEFRTPDEDRIEAVGREQSSTSAQLFAGEIELFPNPADGRLTVRLPRRGYHRAVVYSVTGERMIEQVLDENLYGFHLPTDRLPPGAYRLVLRSRYLPATNELFMVVR